MTPQLKEALDRAAAASGRSQSQEAEFRLERSFLDQRLMIEALGLMYGRGLAGILLMVGESMKMAGQSAGFHATGTLEGSQNWLDCAYAFSQASEAARYVIEHLEPDSDSTPPSASDHSAVIGRANALKIIGEAASGNTMSSNPDATDAERAALLHRALGPLAARLRKFCGAEWLASAKPVGGDQ